MTFIPEVHYANRARMPESELAKHYGHQVAWSVDGTRIVASDEDPLKVCEAVRQAGLKSDDVVHSYVPFPNELILGGAFLDVEDPD